MIKIKKYNSDVLFILTLFPGYFIYNSLVGLGLVFGVLRGYWTPMSLLLIPFLLMVYNKNILKIRDTQRLEVYFYWFMAYFFGATLFNLSLWGRGDIAIPYFSTMLQMLAVFFSARIINISNLASKLNLFIIAFLIMSLLVVFNQENGVFTLGTLADDSLSSSGKLANYQGYALAYFITLILMVPFVKNGFYRILIYFIALYCLFIISARTELVVFILFIFVIEFCLANMKLLFLGLTFSIAMVFTLFKDLIIKFLFDLAPDSRVLYLFLPTDDESVIERKVLFKLFLEKISEHPFLGVYGSYEVGYYPHNLFSVWVDFGIVGFISYLFILILPLVGLLKDFKLNSKNPIYLVTIGSYVVTLTFVAFSKPFTCLFFPFMIGIYCSYVQSTTQTYLKYIKVTKHV